MRLTATRSATVPSGLVKQTHDIDTLDFIDALRAFASCRRARRSKDVDIVDYPLTKFAYACSCICFRWRSAGRGVPNPLSLTTYPVLPKISALQGSTLAT